MRDRIAENSRIEAAYLAFPSEKRRKVDGGLAGWSDDRS